VCGARESVERSGYVLSENSYSEKESEVELRLHRKYTETGRSCAVVHSVLHVLFGIYKILTHLGKNFRQLLEVKFFDSHCSIVLIRNMKDGTDRCKLEARKMWIWRRMKIFVGPINNSRSSAKESD